MAIVWRATHECGNLSEWTRNQASGTLDAHDGTVTVVAGVPGAKGKYCLRAQSNPSESESHVKIFRFYETDELGKCLDGWWGARLMMPTVPTLLDPGWGLNILQVKSVEGRPIYAVVLGMDGAKQTIQFHRYGPNGEWLRSLPVSGVAVPKPGEWFHAEIHFRWHRTLGCGELYWSGARVAGERNQNTIPVAPTWPTRWGAGLYKLSGTSPDVVTLYVDNVTLSTTRVGPNG